MDVATKQIALFVRFTIAFGKEGNILILINKTN